MLNKKTENNNLCWNQGLGFLLGCELLFFYTLIRTHYFHTMIILYFGNIRVTLT